MGKGLNTKTGRFLTFIRQGENPNLFDANGEVTVCSNAEEYTYEEAIDFDTQMRQGSKAAQFNAPLEGMWSGNFKGPLYYNLIDAQLLPYLVAKPVDEDGTASTVGGIAVLDFEYQRPQFGRADRAFFAVQEGKVDDCELGGFGLLTSFKMSSQRGNKGTFRIEVGFATQTAVAFGDMTLTEDTIAEMMVEPLPVLPSHVEMFRADTLAGLDQAGALVGSVQAFEYNESKVCAPVMHHTKVLDPARPDLPPTYDQYVEEEQDATSSQLSVTLDTDDSGQVPALLDTARAGSTHYVSKPQYWRIVMTSPVKPWRITFEFYGSIGDNVPRKFANNIEQRTFMFNLLENPELEWALRWITRRPAPVTP